MYKLALGIFLALFSFSTINLTAEMGAHSKKKSATMRGKCKKDCEDNCSPQCLSAKCDLTFEIPINSNVLLPGETVNISLTTPQGTVTTVPVTFATVSPVVIAVPSPACCGRYVVTVQNINVPALQVTSFIGNSFFFVTNSCNNITLDFPFPFIEALVAVTTLAPGEAVQMPGNITAPYLPCKRCKS